MASDGVEVSRSAEHEPHSPLRTESREKQPVVEPSNKSPEVRSATGGKSRKHEVSPKRKTSNF